MSVNTKKTARWQEIKHNRQGNSFVTHYGQRYYIEEFYFDRNDKANICDYATLPQNNFGGLCLTVCPSGNQAKVWKDFN